MTTTTTEAAETYRNPKRLSETGIRYFVDRRNGQHVVVWEIPADGPNVYRHDTIEAARATWKRLRGVIAGQGYTQRV